ncbi:MAG: hypothetical protein KC416_00575, partial [Myxococcales bacterium]|nr:hypothetical protein [Myxococcales bacterium]
RIVMRVYAYDEKGGSPIAAYARSCRIVYDLWEEAFRIQIQTSGTDLSVRAKSTREVLERCAVARDLPVGAGLDYGSFRGQRIHFAVLAELNPLSADTVRRIRRWLARPAGDRLTGDAFFGSFVGLFVNPTIGKAEKVLRFRTQLVVVPR